MPKVTYNGASKAVKFDGVEFPQGEAVDYEGRRLDALANNRFFDVENPAANTGDKPFPTDDKDKLEAWAKEHLEIDLDKRKGLPKLIAEVEAKLKESAGGAD